MSNPKYFQYFPNIQYADSVNKAGKPNFITIKDYFHLLTVRDDIYREETLYTTYTIKNGERPDQVSYKFYQDEQYYWILLQINNITDYYNQWPLSEKELTEFTYKKYGGAAGAGRIHHYETVATYDEGSPPNLVLPGGLVVPENFKFTYPTSPGSTVYKTTRPINISNFTYERMLNDKKADIFIMDKKYIYDYDKEVRTYAKNLIPSVSYVDSTSNTDPGASVSDVNRVAVRPSSY